MTRSRTSKKGFTHRVSLLEMEEDDLMFLPLPVDDFTIRLTWSRKEREE